MDRSQIAAVILTLLVLGAIAWRLHGPDSNRPPSAGVDPTAPPSTPRKEGTTATSTPVTVAQRLAGVALGNTRYAVVEQPDGTTALYRAGDDVPGLGTIVDVTENSATFEGPDGRIRLNVKPPPSPTFAPPSPTPPPEVEQTRAATTRSPSSPGRSEPESPPSSAPGRPAS